MSDQAPLDSFIDKWRARWPEWGVLSVFVPATQRQRAGAWLALLDELREAAWGGSDPTPGLAKLAWWQEELRGWVKGARRHPLGEVLQKLDAPWDAFGRSLAALPATRAPQRDEDAAQLQAFADSLAECEAALFDGAGQPLPASAAAIALLRGERALVQGDRESAARLAASASRGPVGGRLRRLQQAVVEERLRLLAAGRPPGRTTPLRLLFRGWRAARRG